MSLLCAQKQLLLSFMNEHEELRTGKFTSKFTYKSAQRLWETITETLNSVPNGAVKDWKKWRKTWQDLKKNAKAKNASVKKYSHGTGGGPPPKPLTDFDTEVVEMLSPIQREGLPVNEIQETPIIEFDLNTFYGSNNNGPFQKTSSDKDEDKDVENGKKIMAINDIVAKKAQNENVNGKEREILAPVLEQNDNLKSGRKHTPKRINRTTRLQTSLQLNQKYLNATETRNSFMEQYYKNKNLIENSKLRAKLRLNRMANIWWKHLGPIAPLSFRHF